MTSLFQIIIYILICALTIAIYKKGQKVTVKKIIFISILFTIYNMICTSFSTRTVGDRANYLYEFLGYRTTSTGLTWIFNFVKMFSGNINTVFYISTFICCFLTFYSFFNDSHANKPALIFLLSTDFIFFTFVALKQCYVCAIASLIFYILFNKDGKFKYVIIVILMYIACQFHSTGLLLLPIIIVFILYKNKKINAKLILLVFSIMLVLLDNVLSFVVSNLAEYMPTMANKINEYFYSTGIYTKSATAFLKGAPFYFILIIAIMNYRKYKSIENYDKLLVLTFIGAFAYFITFISYWMYRITALFYLPISLLFGIIYEQETKSKNKFLYIIICILLELFILMRWLFLEFTTGGF